MLFVHSPICMPLIRMEHHYNALAVAVLNKMLTCTRLSQCDHTNKVIAADMLPQLPSRVLVPANDASTAIVAA